MGVVGLDVDGGDVATGAEHLPLTADEEDADVRHRLGDRRHRLGEGAEAAGIEGVAGLGSVEDDLGDRAAGGQADLGHHS